MSLQFEMLDAASGKFTYSNEKEPLKSELDALVNAKKTDQINDKLYVAGLDKLIIKAPTFLDAHLCSAEHWMEKEKPKKALEAAFRGILIGDRLLPDGFKGRIEWKHFDNQIYLRTRQFALSCYVQLQRHKAAVKEIQTILAFNPADEQQVIYSLGSQAMRAGNYELARNAFFDYPSIRSAYFYEMGLYFILKNQFIPAATALRRGFAANTYFVEFLTGYFDNQGTRVPSSIAFPAIDEAGGYHFDHKQFWVKHPESLTFLRELFNDPSILAERAAVMECRIEMLTEHDAQRHAQMAARLHNLISGIDDTLSKSVLQPTSHIGAAS